MSVQKSQRQFVRFPTVEGIQGFAKDGLFGCGFHEQGQAGAEFHVIGTAKDGVGRALRMEKHQLDTFFEPWSQDGMAQVLSGFLKVGNAIVDGGVAASQGFVLREHKAYPVGNFFACFQFGHGLVQADVLGGDKAL